MDKSHHVDPLSKLALLCLAPSLYLRYLAFAQNSQVEAIDGRIPRR